MRRRRHGWIALAGLLLIGGLVAAPGTEAAADDSSDDGTSVALVGPLVAALDVDAPGAYWTPERMEQAIPLGLDPDGDAVDAAPRAAAPRARGALTSPRSVGKLFFSDRTSDYVCSAATVNTADKNVIITAGHCVNTGGRRGLLGGCTAGSTYNNFLFVPRYANGSAPDGRWVGTRAIMHREWVERCDAFTYDNALVELAPRNGRRLVDVVGGNGLALNFPARETGVRVWGWPAEAPYDGETVRRCAGESYQFSATGTDAAIACGLTGGASGGPWFVSMASPQVGFIWAVTSRRTTTGAAYLLATPLTGSVRTLLGAARAARPLAPVGVTGAGRVVVTRAGVAFRALPGRVGRGQLLRLRARAGASTPVVLSIRLRPHGPWRRLRVARTDRDGVVEFAFRPTRVGALRYRLRTPRTSVSVAVRVLSCPLPRDRSVAEDTVCTQPTA
ncbi:trypsin-like serine peptidase [Nocardioides caeni]|uniref:Trypsin-like serine protease n=1 Tax=Nocardioides caeni TaxID=574700 RepID=A0A4V4HK74_9ACTN|nr:hypothetical protein [Nocardioides caeni]THV13286.1 hypothetical protein E9934_09965 [Nocardioides caeni]